MMWHLVEFHDVIFMMLGLPEFYVHKWSLFHQVAHPLEFIISDRIYKYQGVKEFHMLARIGSL